MNKANVLASLVLVSTISAHAAPDEQHKAALAAKVKVEAAGSAVCLDPKLVTKQKQDAEAKRSGEEKATEARLSGFAEKLEVVYAKLRTHQVDIRPVKSFDEFIKKENDKKSYVALLRTSPLPTDAQRSRKEVKALLSESNDLLNQISLNLGYLQGVQSQRSGLSSTMAIGAAQ